MNKQYRVGVIGCGGMGRSHAQAFTELESTVVVAVSDIDETAAKGIATEFSIPSVYTDYHEILEKENLDIVSIPTWQGVRAEITVAAAASGIKAILGEKPIANSLGGADDMIKACNQHHVKLAIGHHGRFTPTLNEIRRLVADGAIGEPTMLYHRAKPNAGLLNTGTHAIDSWRYILGDPENKWVIGNVSRTSDRWERRSPCEDLCMGLVCFSSGARGIYEGDLPEPTVPMPVISGTEGQIRTENQGGIPSGRIFLQRSNHSSWLQIEPAPVRTTQYDELIEWTEGKLPDHRSNGYKGRATLEVLMGIFESVRIKGVVSMPLHTRDCPLDTMIADGSLPVLTKGRYDLRKPFPEELESASE